MFYKAEDGRLLKAPEKSLKIFIANPTEEQYRFFGYTNKIIEDQRPDEEEGKYIEEYYVQEDDVITKKYKVLDIPELQKETE